MTTNGNKQPLSTFMYVGSMVVPTAYGQGAKSRRFPLMAGFGPNPVDNYLICGVHQIVDTPITLADFQFFITDRMMIYKQTESYEPRGTSFDSP